MQARFVDARRRDQRVVIFGIATLCLLSWLYLFRLAGPGHAMEMMAPHSHAPSGADLLWLNFIMWSVMMVGMMLPAATPVVLGFTRVQRQRQEERTATHRIALFVSGYLMMWLLFSAIAALLQWLLHSWGMMTAAMGSATPVLSGIFVLAAGLFQWSGLKDRCMTLCRSPMQFLLTEWRESAGGALRMGIQYGLYCLGCCWLLMLLMFAAGVMNLLWMVGLTVYLLAEKLLPGMAIVSRLVGALLVATGTLILLGAALF